MPQIYVGKVVGVTSRSAKIAATLAAILATPIAAHAYPHLTVPRVEAPPSLDPSDAVRGWSEGVEADLPWDELRARPASEATKAIVATDGMALYVRFEATQREPVTATANTNDVGQGNDDSVWIDLWPNGKAGYFYQFYATPNGTHYQFSSENTAYAPIWESRGTIRDGGYTVTMRIPLDVLRNARGGTWSAQFVRYIRATGEQQVWSHTTNVMFADSYGNGDYAHSGTITMPSLTTAKRPKARIATYALAEAASKTIGGSTSRLGADLSIPITPTASFYSTLHPDYSNVELDQQTISPTVIQRAYAEVRPFFTQAASFYNYVACNVCPGILPLYTPAIPTPAQGYALEGKQGPLGFAAFDAIGDQRNDVASALDYTSPDDRWSSNVQRVAVNTTSVTDDVTTAGLKYSDLSHTAAYLIYGNDAGSNVAVPDQAQYYEGGTYWTSQTVGIFGALRKVGEYFNPVDGFVFHPGVAGYALYGADIWNFTGSSKLVAAGVSGFVDRYQGQTGGMAQSDNQIQFDLLTKSALDFQVYAGSDYFRFGDILTPVSQNAGASITYHSGLQTSSPASFPYHGSSSFPTTITYDTGQYGTGRLDTWLRSTTIRIGNRGALTFTLDDTAQWLPSASANIQWLEGISYAYQIDRSSSLAMGVRRIVGTPPVPNGGGDCVGSCSNVSVAYHLRLSHSEFYLAYGNPNSLVTVPQAIFKVIFYAGAEKGT